MVHTENLKENPGKQKKSPEKQKNSPEKENLNLENQKDDLPKDVNIIYHNFFRIMKYFII